MNGSKPGGGVGADDFNGSNPAGGAGGVVASWIGSKPGGGAGALLMQSGYSLGRRTSNPGAKDALGGREKSEATAPEVPTIIVRTPPHVPAVAPN